MHTDARIFTYLLQYLLTATPTPTLENNSIGKFELTSAYISVANHTVALLTGLEMYSYDGSIDRDFTHTIIAVAYFIRMTENVNITSSRLKGVTSSIAIANICTSACVQSVLPIVVP